MFLVNYLWKINEGIEKSSKDDNSCTVTESAVRHLTGFLQKMFFIFFVFVTLRERKFPFNAMNLSKINKTIFMRTQKSNPILTEEDAEG